MLCKACEFFFSRGGNEGYCACSGKVIVGDHEETDCIYLDEGDYE